MPSLPVNVTSFSSTCEILSSSSAWSVTDPSLSCGLDCSFKSPVGNIQYSTYIYTLTHRNNLWDEDHST